MTTATAPCVGCTAGREATLIQLGLRPDKWDYLVALAGNPNTGKSTVFNALTGLRQHTGNWPGKTVTRAEGAADMAPSETLVQLRPGESAEVVRISPACRGAQRRRLLDLGVLPGTVVSAEFEGALSDPMAYRIRGAVIALRKNQAEWIYITRRTGGEPN